MLAYVFWHARDARVEDREYVERLLDFHRALAKVRPGGLLRAVVRRVRGAPWIANGGDAFEEWYFLKGSGALDVLNDAAVSGECRDPHNAVARLAAAGCAGLYRLHYGAGDDAALDAVAQSSAPNSFEEYLMEVVSRRPREAGSLADSFFSRRHEGAQTTVRHAAWFAKPSGMTYADLDAQLRPLVEAEGATLWQRQMVLGPPYEFCLRSTSAVTLHAPFVATSTTLEIVTPKEES